MSQQEFDNYLNLLSSMLRLNRKQRAAIADEFRSHLEDRLEDLLARGISRDQAIEMALSEFGDAAGLAGELSVVSSIRRKRWIMRVSALSMAACVLLGLGLLSFWPDARQAVAPARAIAQGGGEATPAPPVVPANKPALSLEKQIEAEINESLNKRIDLEFENIPLKDVLAKLSEQTDLQFYIDTTALKDSGVEPELPISIQLKQISTRSALKLILSGNQLTYIPDDGFIKVTTLDKADSQITVRVYNCRDILFSHQHFFGALANSGGAIGTYEYSTHATGIPPGMSGGMMGGGMGGGGNGFFGINDEVTSGPQAALPQMGGMGGGGAGAMPGSMPGMGGGLGTPQPPATAPTTTHQRRARQLMSLITTTVSPDSWSEVGGSGAIAEFDGLLVVTQTAAVHLGVENVLTMLRESASKSNEGMDFYHPSSQIPGTPGMPGMGPPSLTPGGGPPPVYPPGTSGFPGSYNSPPRTDSGYEPPRGLVPDPNNAVPPGSSFGVPGPGASPVPGTIYPPSNDQRPKSSVPAPSNVPFSSPGKKN